jgi:16S rRNA (cytosine967-C5)-methyltransferase
LPKELRERPFDRILVDAPCSGLGVLRRHPEGKWRKEAEALPQHQRLQLRLLEQMPRLLRPGGVLVYSTCSSEPEENEQVIVRFCRAHKEFRRESVAPWLPRQGSSLMTGQGELSTMRNDDAMDMFFAARLRKAS